MDINIKEFFFKKINELTLKIVPLFDSIKSFLTDDAILSINFIICIILFCIEIIYIIGIAVFNFTENNVSIMGGLLVLTYLLLFIFVIIKIIMAFFYMYKRLSANDNSYSIETNIYSSFRELFTKIPYDIGFIVIVSTILASFDSLTNNSSVFRTAMFFGLGIIIPILLLVLIISFIGKKINYFNIKFFTPLFFILFYLITYLCLILLLTTLVKRSIFLNIFDSVSNYIENDGEEVNDSTNIANNLKSRFLIFKDIPDINNESGYYYFIGLFSLIILLLVQIFIIYLTKRNSKSVRLLVESLTSLVDTIYNHFQIPKNKLDILKYQQDKYIEGLNKINKKLLNQNGGKKKQDKKK